MEGKSSFPRFTVTLRYVYCLTTELFFNQLRWHNKFVYNDSSLSLLRSNKLIICFAYFVLLKCVLKTEERHYNFGTKMPANLVKVAHLFSCSGLANGKVDFSNCSTYVQLVTYEFCEESSRDEITSREFQAYDARELRVLFPRNVENRRSLAIIEAFTTMPRGVR